jgi:hypothetical protein
MYFYTAVTFVFLVCTMAHAVAPVELEIATERGVQITAPHEWLQLLTSLGIENARIRGAQPGERPRAENRGTAERPRRHVLGLLTARNELRLPGGTFTRADRTRLKDYFDRLSADGAEALTAPRGLFGLTEKEADAVFADLAQPIQLATKGKQPHAVLDKVATTFQSRIVLDPKAERTLRSATPIIDELSNLTAGTGLAILLRTHGLVLRPEKPRGQPANYRIELAAADVVGENTLGKTDDHSLQHWPIGWEPQYAPGEIAPSLFEFLNAEIDGYTLDEALAAIAPRIKIPLYLDHAALAAHDIAPSAIQINLPRTRISYKRLLDRILSKARLGCQIRVDEAGTPFLWITR